MTIKRRINYTSNKQITVLHHNDEYIWVAFAKNSDDICIIKKQYAFEPAQTFFSLEKEVDEIVALDSNTTKLFAAYTDDTLLGEILSLTNPLTSTTEIEIPSGILESPVDVKVDGTDLWFLLPGDLSGTNAQLIKYDTSGNFIEIVDLSNSLGTVINATSMTIDENSDIWIVTNTSPVQVIRVFQLSGGDYDFTITDIV